MALFASHGGRRGRRVMNKIIRQTYHRYYVWLLGLGMSGAVAFGTLVAIVGSVLTTAVVMLLIPGPKDFFWYGMIVAVVSPALTAPGLSSIAFKMAFQLNTTQAALKLAAETDALTGVSNRRSFMTQAELAFANAKAGGTPFTIVMIDIDHFKAINDTHGHSIGDSVLRDVAQACQAALRASDCFARFGGEEFVALLQLTDTAGATAVAEILRKTVAVLAFENRMPPTVTVSLGVASYLASSESLHDILNEADRQLYAAKAAGRNRVMVSATAVRRAS
ncbi:diguanylate cyclase (GGDEF) domain-containing protein [Devosia psychrophila]|uniref:diguanylate cyclase n=2 Tax=Devosia psychrophila TaxID=728005 RepID=A0A1I1HBB2_9HYPH|nr:diguanylate cyclase (GGDEF) domain-containing protein [Devosia psychrophila]